MFGQPRSEHGHHVGQEFLQVRQAFLPVRVRKGQIDAVAIFVRNKIQIDIEQPAPGLIDGR